MHAHSRNRVTAQQRMGRSGEARRYRRERVSPRTCGATRKAAGKFRQQHRRCGTNASAAGKPWRVHAGRQRASCRKLARCWRHPGAPKEEQSRQPAAAAGRAPTRPHLIAKPTRYRADHHLLPVFPPVSPVPSPPPARLAVAGGSRNHHRGGKGTLGRTFLHAFTHATRLRATLPLPPPHRVPADATFLAAARSILLFLKEKKLFGFAGSWLDFVERHELGTLSGRGPH